MDGTPVIFEAIEFAARAHSGQYRKGTQIPYIVHPLAVARILIEHGCSEQVRVAGVLHDTVEDTEVTIDAIELRFGPEVARLVSGATDPDANEFQWEYRKQHTLTFLENAPDDSLLVSIADKLDNIRSIHEEVGRLGDAAWDRFHRPRENQRWYYYALLDVFARRMTQPPGTHLLEAFRREVCAVFEIS